MQNIKNIIFDLGGVFMTVHYQNTQKAFEDLGVAHFKELFTQHYSSDIFEKLEKGTISELDFYEAFRKEINVSFTDAQIKTAWNAMLGTFPKERLAWLSEIKNKYNIYLFSNTNQIHYDAFMERFEHETGKNNLNDYFIKAYYSHELGLRKPHPESYLKIIEEQKLIAAETLFIDDTFSNIEGAKEAGLQAVHLPPPMTVFDLGL